MKRNKVLLGLYVGLLTLAGGGVNAQTSRFYEIGPANIGGEISCIVVDRQDTSRNTLYAGAATGGLFLKSTSMDILRNLYNNLAVDATRAEILAADTMGWHHVPFIQNGKEISLPISCMAQGPNNVLYIGTGSDVHPYGTTYTQMSRKGMGIYRYNPQTNEFALIPTTNPANDTNFSTINAIELLYSDNTLYLYAATNNGLYRWLMVDGNDNWSATPTRVFAGRVDNIVISRPHKVAFFSSGNQLYRIGDVTAAPSALNTINISSSNNAFGGNNIGMKLAVSQTDTMFLYAMVINQSGYMDALYLTMNEQTWFTLTTSTIMPLTYNSGKECGAVTVDPSNPRRVFIAGTDVYVGRGYVDGNYYQWITASASEHSLNYGDYMGTVYGNGSFVHSGIHQMVPVYRNGSEGVPGYHTFYIATDGGIFSAKHYGDAGFGAFKSENRGLNTVQINDLAVAPDGTIIMGANKNSCPIVETHLTHNGGTPTLSWYDDGSLGNLNHDANVLWSGNGGSVAASAFQQVKPLSRRTIFTTSSAGFAGRSYADYLNYTNTTTWTIGESFTTNKIVDGPEIGSISLWETANNTMFNDSLMMGVDTLGFIFRKNGSNWDTLWVNDTAFGANRGSKFQIRRGDKAIFYSRANADYPFEYTFTSNMKAKDSVKVINPIQSRMLMIGEAARVDYTALGTVGYPRSVWMAWYPTDFTRVWDESIETDADNMHELYEKLHYWSQIYCVERKEGTSTENVYPRLATFSRDGLSAYVANFDAVTHQSMLVRIRGFQNIDYSKSNRQLIEELSYTNSVRPLTVDTLRYNGSVWFPRPISHIAVDGRNGQDRLVLTFEDYSTAMANVAVVNNASQNSYSITAMPINNTDMPAYCAIVEDSTGTIYVGTADGVYTKSGSASWQAYNNLFGVPVTAIVQQTGKLPVRRNLTHTGINANKYVFAKTKWPRAIYFGTYGRGVFMDMKYVTDTINEICDSSDYNNVSIPTVHSVSPNSLKLYPNPVYNEANLVINANAAGSAVLRIYDLNGRLVMNRNLGYVAEGEQLYSIDCTGMSKGMYLINVIIGGHTSTAKMIVK